MMFDWAGFGIGALVGLTAFFGCGAVSLANDGDGAAWVFYGLFIAGCALIGGLS